MKARRLAAALILAGAAWGTAEAGSAQVYVRAVQAPMETVYKRVFGSLENNGYFVIVEPNIGRNLAHFAQRWGKDYNRNRLESIRSMVFCNGWYANQVGNADPDMLALCPLHVTLTHKAGETRILFVRPSQVAAGSPAEAVALELEQDVIRTIEESLTGLKTLDTGGADRPPGDGKPGAQAPGPAR